MYVDTVFAIFVKVFLISKCGVLVGTLFLVSLLFPLYRMHLSPSSEGELRKEKQSVY